MLVARYYMTILCIMSLTFFYACDEEENNATLETDPMAGMDSGTQAGAPSGVEAGEVSSGTEAGTQAGTEAGTQAGT